MALPSFLYFFDRKSQIRRALLLFIIASLGGPALASDFQSPRTAALGGAGHASPLLNDTIFLNPAYSSFIQAYSLAWSFQSIPADTANPKGRGYQVSVLDGRSQMFQAGVAYTVRSDGTFVYLGGSKAVMEKLSIGVSGKTILRSNLGQQRAHDATLAIAFLPLESIGTVLVIDNVFETTSGRAHGMQREFILGTRWTVAPKFSILFDPQYKPNAVPGKNWGYEAGMEVAPFTDLYVRAGTFHNATVSATRSLGDGYGIGAGWMAPKLTLDYAYQKVTSNSSRSHLFGFSVYF